MSRNAAELTDEDLPQACLGHKHPAGDPASDSIKITWDLYPVVIPRPAAGRTTATVACGTCGRRLSCMVSSPARLHRQRRLRLAAGLVLTVPGAGYLAAFAILTAWGALDATAIVIMGSAGTMALILVINGMIMINEARLAMGVRLQRDNQHEVRQPGSTVSYEPRFRDINI
jgi:hypothetical protein